MNDGKNQVACCNEESEDGDTVGGLIGSLDGLLGGNCQPITIPIGLISAAVPITDYCNTQVACCSGDQNVSITWFPRTSRSLIANTLYRALSTSLALRSASKLRMGIPDWITASLGVTFWFGTHDAHDDGN